MYVKIVYGCERCHSEHDHHNWVFPCHECGQEICEDCMYGWGVCQKCAEGKTNKELKEKFEKRHETR